MSSAPLTTQHKMMNRYLVTNGCVTEDEMKECYDQIKATYPGRIRTRNNKSELEQIIDDINRFMHFMNASVVSYDYELNQTRYYAYQLAIVHTDDDLITKHSMNLPLNQLHLFKKLLDLSLKNNGLITRKAIEQLNDILNRRYTSNNDMVSGDKLQRLIDFVCRRRYLYKLSDQDEKQELDANEGKHGEDESFCIGPRALVGLQTYIEKKTESVENLRNCPICFDVMIGYGFQCPMDKCSAVYHAKCTRSIKQSKKCASCQQEWGFDPTTRIGLLSDPAITEDLVTGFLTEEKSSDNNHNHNENSNNRERMDEEEEEKEEKEIEVSAEEDEKEKETQSQPQTRRRSKRLQSMIHQDSEDSD